MSKRRKRSQSPQRAGTRETPKMGRPTADDETGSGRKSDKGGRPAYRGSSGEARPGSGASLADRPTARRANASASNWSLALQLLFLAAVFAIVVLIAELAGAANLGVALGVGQIAFAIAVIYLLVRR